MPAEVIRNGKTYYEYSPHELEKARNDQLTQLYLKRGQFKFAQGQHQTTQDGRAGNKKGIR